MARQRTPAARGSGEPVRRAKKNPLITAGVETVDYKNVALLRTFISDRGKIRNRRVTHLTPRQQRRIAVAIKNAREMALLPYTAG